MRAVLETLSRWPLDASAEPDATGRVWPPSLIRNIESGAYCFVTASRGSGKTALSMDLGDAFKNFAVKANLRELTRAIAERMREGAAMNGVEARLRVREQLLFMTLAAMSRDPATPGDLRKSLTKFTRAGVKDLDGRRNFEVSLGLGLGELIAPFADELKFAYRTIDRGKKPSLEERVPILERLVQTGRRVALSTRRTSKIWCVLDDVGGQVGDSATAAATLEAIHSYFVDFAPFQVAPLALVDRATFEAIAREGRGFLSSAQTDIDWTSRSLLAALDAEISRRTGREIQNFSSLFLLPDEINANELVLGVCRGRIRDAVRCLKCCVESMLSVPRPARIERDLLETALADFARQLCADAEREWGVLSPSLRDIAGVFSVPDGEAISVQLGYLLKQGLGPEGARATLARLYDLGLIELVDEAGSRRTVWRNDPFVSDPSFVVRPHWLARHGLDASLPIRLAMTASLPKLSAIEPIETTEPAAAPIPRLAIESSTDAEHETRLDSELASAPRLILSNSSPDAGAAALKGSPQLQLDAISSPEKEAPRPNPPRLVLPDDDKP